MSLVSAFNKVLIDFAKELETTFPQDSDFVIFRRGIEDFIKYNSVGTVTMFKSYIAPIEQDNGNGNITVVDIKQKILNNDSSFFLDEMDYESQIVAKGYKKDNSFNTINKIKQYWTSLTPQGQKSVMDYLCLLVKVSDKINQ